MRKPEDLTIESVREMLQDLPKDLVFCPPGPDFQTTCMMAYWLNENQPLPADSGGTYSVEAKQGFYAVVYEQKNRLLDRLVNWFDVERLGQPITVEKTLELFNRDFPQEPTA